MKNKLGMILAAYLGLWHLSWSLLVALGVAQSVLDWVLGLHFIDNSTGLRIGTFHWLTALELVGFTTIFGYIVGWLIGLAWELLHKEREQFQGHAPVHTVPVH